MKAPSKKATWVGVAMLALTMLSSYLGLDKAGYINQPPSTQESTSTNTTTTTITNGGLSAQEVEVIVNRMVKAGVNAHECGGKYHSC